MKKVEKTKTKVLIATPTMDGKLEAYYVDSLLNTLVLGAAKGYDIKHLFVGYDSLLPRARNDLVKAAIDSDMDCTVWEPDHDAYLNNILDVVDFVAIVASFT